MIIIYLVISIFLLLPISIIIILSLFSIYTHASYKLARLLSYSYFLFLLLLVVFKLFIYFYLFARVSYKWRFEKNTHESMTLWHLENPPTKICILYLKFKCNHITKVHCAVNS